MKYIAVFENDYETFRGAFETAQIYLEADSIPITISPFPSSNNQDVINNLSADHIFIDLDLSKNNIINGYDIIKLLILKNYNTSNITIITGNITAQEQFTEKGIVASLRILNKPFDFENIYDILKK